MNINHIHLQIAPKGNPDSARVERAWMLVGSALCALLAATAVADGNLSHEIRQLGEGRSMVTVEPADPWQPEGFPSAEVVRAAPVEEGPVIDGRLHDQAWDNAAAITVPLAWGRVPEATVRAVYTDREVFISVSWPDPTRDDQHHPWVWDAAQGRYVEGPQVEDALLVSIEGGCDWNPSLLANQIYDFDAWVWMAARSNPLGQAVDADGNVQDQPMGDPAYVRYQTRYPDPTWNVKFIDRRANILTLPWQDLERMYKLVPPEREIYVRYLPDGGGQVPEFVERLAAPSQPLQAMAVGLGSTDAEAAAVAAPQYRPIPLTGDAGDVAAKGQWADGRWTVEFRRALVTDARTSSDSVFQRTTQFSIQVFDRVERLDETSESGRLLLKFEPAKKEQVPEDTTVLATR
jgi:hypothetical protein